MVTNVEKHRGDEYNGMRFARIGVKLILTYCF